jgi:hypothetical protein
MRLTESSSAFLRKQVETIRPVTAWWSGGKAAPDETVKGEQVEIEVTYTPALIGVGPEVGDDVNASCDAFEVQVHLELSARYPDADITVTRDQGHLADLSVVTHGFVDQRGVLTVRQAVWSDVWDMIGPYGRYRRPVRGGILQASVPVVVVRPERRPDVFVILVDDASGDSVIEECDEDEARAVMRSGFGVMA